MSAITRLAAGDLGPELKRTHFRSKRIALPEDVMQRQTALSLAAFQRFATRVEALNFLNSANESLGGRPIDVAASQRSGLVDALAVLQRTTRPTQHSQIDNR